MHLSLALLQMLVRPPGPVATLRAPARKAFPCAHTDMRVDRAQQVVLVLRSGTVGDERHLIFECAALASLRSVQTLYRYWERFSDIMMLLAHYHGYVGRA